MRREAIKSVKLDNIVDPLTKTLVQQKHDGHTGSISIRCMLG